MAAPLRSWLERAEIMLFARCACLAVVVGCSPAEPPTPPPLEIVVVEVLQRDQPISMDMIGETRGSRDIPIRARVEGVLTEMSFIEGRSVEKDQLLYAIDPEPFEAEVVEAEGSMAEVMTQLVKAKADLARIKPLAEMNAVSQVDLDSAVAQYDAARGALQSAEARVEQTQIRLGYTRIHSPIEGRIGISEARVGEFVGKNPNPVVLNFVSQADPIRVRFSIDERTYLRLAKRFREFQEQSKDKREAKLKSGQGLQLTLADGSVHPHLGRTVAADASVDPKTGTFTLEADFPNPGSVVLAGQFARVRAVAEVLKDALLIPSRSASELQGKFRVYVVGADGIVELRSVELGPVVENFRVVTSGLKVGERVAVEIMKLQPGMKVSPKLAVVNDSGKLEEPSDMPDSAETNKPEASAGSPPPANPPANKEP